MNCTTIFKKNKEGITESVFEAWLFELNLNCLDFVDYKTDEITKTLEGMDSDIEKKDLLYHLLKKFNQSRNKNFRKFNQKIPSIKDQLIIWVEEEIEYLSRKKSLTINNTANTSNSSAKIKIQTNLSVAHFSYFNKLLMQAKVLSHDNNSEFFRFIVDNYKTKATENTSSDSFKTKYHNVEENTICNPTITNQIIQPCEVRGLPSSSFSIQNHPSEVNLHCLWKASHQYLIVRFVS